MPKSLTPSPLLGHPGAHQNTGPVNSAGDGSNTTLVSIVFRMWEEHAHTDLWGLSLAVPSYAAFPAQPPRQHWAKTSLLIRRYLLFCQIIIFTIFHWQSPPFSPIATQHYIGISSLPFAKSSLYWQALKENFSSGNIWPHLGSSLSLSMPTPGPLRTPSLRYMEHWVCIMCLMCVATGEWVSEEAWAAILGFLWKKKNKVLAHVINAKAFRRNWTE